jgi:hypothetical protein
MLSQTVPIQKFRRKIGVAVGEQGEGCGVWGVGCGEQGEGRGVWGVGRESSSICTKNSHRQFKFSTANPNYLRAKVAENRHNSRHPYR